MIAVLLNAGRLPKADIESVVGKTLANRVVAALRSESRDPNDNKVVRSEEPESEDGLGEGSSNLVLFLFRRLEDRLGGRIQPW